ncbi:MAG: zinc-dependent alcohol dehydrogenase [Nitrososphaerales archaeon]
MKAFLLIGKNQAKISERPDPKITSPEQVIVGIKSISICGTDSHIYSGDIATGKMPIIMGHEAGGVILETGSKVEGLSRGTNVLVDPNIIDYTCDLCLRGLTNLCRNGGILGRDADGVFSERIAVNANSVYKLPPTINDEIIPLIQPLSTVARGMSFLTIRPGDTVLIIGLGAVGLLFAQLCKLEGATVLGARRTWQGHMLPISKEFGVDHPINTSKSNLMDDVRRVTNGKGPDVIILAANAPEMIQACLDIVRPGGTILQFFNFHGTGSYETYEMYMKEVKLITSRSSIPADFAHSINLVTSGKIPLAKMITGRYRFEEAERALAANEDRKKSLKVIISI